MAGLRSSQRFSAAGQSGKQEKTKTTSTESSSELKGAYHANVHRKRLNVADVQWSACDIMRMPRLAVGPLVKQGAAWTAATFLAMVVAASSGQADINNWQTGETIPGTEGITPGPGIYLSGRNSDSRNLRYADFAGGADLHRSRFYHSWLDNARFTQANLTNANFDRARLTNADLSGAMVKGASFGATTSRGFTKEQLYSTASYQEKDLTGTSLASNNLSGWDFAGQNLTGGQFNRARLTNADLSGPWLRGQVSATQRHVALPKSSFTPRPVIKRETSQASDCIQTIFPAGTSPGKT